MLAPRWHEVARPERRMRAHGRTRTKRRKRNIRWPRQWQNKDRRRGRSWWRGTHGGPQTDAQQARKRLGWPCRMVYPASAFRARQKAATLRRKLGRKCGGRGWHQHSMLVLALHL